MFQCFINRISSTFSVQEAGINRRTPADQLRPLYLINGRVSSIYCPRDFSDFQLNSALGRYDGRAYEALLETTKVTCTARSRNASLFLRGGAVE